MEQLITSSVLILSICIVRIVFEKKISPCIKYALWLLVAVKLLVPIPDFETNLSVMNVAKSIERTEEEVDFQGRGTEKQEPFVWDTPDKVKGNTDVLKENTDTKPKKTQEIISRTGQIGAVFFAVVFLVSNLSFYWKLRKKRKFMANYKGLKIYEIDGLGSPCLYGVRKPAIYLNPEVCSEEEKLTYILLHEYTHYRHRDYVWAVLRCLCIIRYWYNPLVWLAANLSVKDGELACDAGVIHQIGEENRIAYGKVLVDTLKKISEMPERENPLGLSTSMTKGGKDMKKRMKMIVKRPKTKVITVVLMAVICLGLIGCTYGKAVRNADDTVNGADAVEKSGSTAIRDNTILSEDEISDVKEFTMEQLLALCQEGGEALQEAFTIDTKNGELPYSNFMREEDERWLTWLYRVPLSYKERKYELQISYWVPETAEEYGHTANELDNINISMVEPATSDAQLLYDCDKRFTPNLDVQSFLTKEYDIRKYVDFKLPAGLSLGEYDTNLNAMWQGCVFNGEFEEPAHGEFAPQSWYAPGGIGFVKMEDFSECVHFENGVLQTVEWMMNHSGRDSEFETVEGCDRQAILCEYFFDVFTIPEEEEYRKEHGLEEGEVQTESRYWYVFFAEPDSEYVYTLFLNQAYFGKEDVIKMAKTLKFEK